METTEPKKKPKKKSTWMRGFRVAPRNTTFLPDWRTNPKKLPPNTRDT